MFEQAQIQEFKEVSTLSQTASHPRGARFTPHADCSSLGVSGPPSNLAHITQDSPFPAFPGRDGVSSSHLKAISSQAFSCIDQNRDGIICKSDLKETYSQLGE